MSERGQAYERAALEPRAPGRYEPRFSRHDPAAGSERAWPPRILEEELAARVVDPRRWEPMRRFWAGHSQEPASAEVNGSARKLYDGHLAPQVAAIGGAPFQRIVALTRPSGALVGWCGILRRHLADRLVPIEPGAYIFAIATDHAYRGLRVRLEGETLRPGSAVMLAALAQIERDWDGAMPYVWARVKPGNLASQRMFDRHGFLSFPSPGKDTVRVRPAARAAG